LFRFLVGRLGSRADAEDALQETFLRLARDAGWAVRAKEITPYLFTVARNEAIRLIERRGMRTQALADTLADATPAAEQFDDQEWLRMAVGKLPAPQKEVLELKVFGELTFAQIAIVLDIPQGTAATRYRDALSHLRSQLPRDENARF
jgi:RNA polymerase sigma-70 factor (ECF subfamily)